MLFTIVWLKLVLEVFADGLRFLLSWFGAEVEEFVVFKVEIIKELEGVGVGVGTGVDVGF